MPRFIGQPQRIPPQRFDEMTPQARAEAEAFRSVNSDRSGNPVLLGDVPALIGTMTRHPNLWRQHTEMANTLFSIAKKAGRSDADIEWITRGNRAPGWSGRDRALVAAVEQLHASAMIDDATWAELASHFKEKQLIELPMLVGHYTTIASYQNTLRLAP